MSLLVTTIAWTRFRKSTFPFCRLKANNEKPSLASTSKLFLHTRRLRFFIVGVNVFIYKQPLLLPQHPLIPLIFLNKFTNPPLIFLTTLILIGPNPLSNYFLKLTFLTAAILMLFSSFSSSILFLIILSELSWLLFFCFTHAVLKAFAIQAVLLIFIFFLAIATPTKVLDSPGNSLTNYNPGSF